MIKLAANSNSTSQITLGSMFLIGIVKISYTVLKCSYGCYFCHSKLCTKLLPLKINGKNIMLIGFSNIICWNFSYGVSVRSYSVQCRLPLTS